MVLFFANVQGHRRRTAGVTDAARNEQASGMPVGRRSVHRLVRMGSLSGSRSAVKSRGVSFRRHERVSDGILFAWRFLSSQDWIGLFDEHE
jgi:hypothetical protein